MVVYRNFKAVYLGFKRWRIFVPAGWHFDCKAGNIIALIEKIERWRLSEWALQN